MSKHYTHQIPPWDPYPPCKPQEHKWEKIWAYVQVLDNGWTKSHTVGHRCTRCKKNDAQ